MRVKVEMDIEFDQASDTPEEKEAFLNSCKSFLAECGEGYHIDTEVHSIEEATNNQPLIKKINNKTYHLFQVAEMTYKEIKEKNLSQIVATSNFDNEMFTEKVVARDISLGLMPTIAEAVDQRNSSYSDVFYKASAPDYDLHIFEP